MKSTNMPVGRKEYTINSAPAMGENMELDVVQTAMPCLGATMVRNNLTICVDQDKLHAFGGNNGSK